jgi:DNA (cytosine-5)-methyltransferase 1
MFRIIQELTPRWVIGENVKGLTNIQDGVVFETVCSDLEGEGYEVRAFNIPAAGVGAPHRRERIWIVAHAKRFNESKPIGRSDETSRGIQEEHRQNDSSARESSRTSSIRQSNNRHENMEDSRRTLQSRTELRETNEDEVREGYANQHQRSGSTSESNVANANSERPQGHGEEYELRKDSQEIKASGSSSSAREDVADTEQSRSSSESIGDIGSVGKESSKEKERGNQPSVRTSTRSTDVANTESSIGNDNEAVAGNGESSTQEIFGDGSSVSGESTWWYTEPDVGRVAHGVPGRVYRLKGLGNSIVPQIAEEIGKAIIKAEKKGGHYE